MFKIMVKDNRGMLENYNIPNPNDAAMLWGEFRARTCYTVRPTALQAAYNNHIFLVHRYDRIPRELQDLALEEDIEIRKTLQDYIPEMEHDELVELFITAMAERCG
jgi:hypothetical protein